MAQQNQVVDSQVALAGPIDCGEQWLGLAKARTGAIEKNPAHFFNWR
ncbi:MAG: hypothetical protein R2724_06275 [Bryobacterales bacterium]